MLICAGLQLNAGSGPGRHVFANAAGRPIVTAGRHGGAKAGRGHGSYGLAGVVPGASSLGFDDSWLGESYGEPPVIQPQVLAPYMPPPMAARPVLLEYPWPESPGPSAATFSLVLKDGSVRFAAAVWEQDGAVHYTAADGIAGELPLDAIDADATHRLNAEAGLVLWLTPAPAVR